MGILDDAIKEHLELKRQHGAAESELKQLEDEAFGAAERPGDAPTDPVAEAPTEFMAQPEMAEEKPRSRRPDVADLQEAPPPPAESSAEPEAPAEEESPAMEHEAVTEPAAKPEAPASEPEISSGPTTEEREAIADQPTEMFDVEEELASSPAAPSEEDEAEEEYEEDDDFWDEKRLSDELDQALEAPIEVEIKEKEEPEAGEHDEGDAAEEEEESHADAAHEEDVLEETPDFLEETPEDDQLWFEQKPPKDFDFDD
jgi:hypothetical protein